MTIINVCIACDDNYAKYAGVTIASILHNANEEDELVIMRMIKTDDECTFEIIEDDDEFNSVAQAITDSDDLDEE